MPNTSATAASSGADLNGGAVKNACEQIRARLAQVAARSASPGDVRSRRDVSGLGSESLPFAELVQRPTSTRAAVGGRLLPTEGLHWDAAAMQGEPFKYFAYGVAATEVEVDGFTGAYRLRRVDIVHDVGDSLSPLIDIGQIEGGFVQGAGWLTLEDLRWDESGRPGRGRLPTQAASTYKLPSFSEMPEVFNVHAAGERARGRRGLRLQGRRRAAADAGVLRARGAAAGGRGVRPARAQRRPARPGDAGAVFWAVAGARGTRRCPAGSAAVEPVERPGVRAVDWIKAVERLQT